jgi:hypothetical protein
MRTVNLSIIDDTPRSFPGEVRKNYHVKINLPEESDAREVDVVLKVSELQQVATSSTTASKKKGPAK